MKAKEKLTFIRYTTPALLSLLMCACTQTEKSLSIPPADAPARVPFTATYKVEVITPEAGGEPERKLREDTVASNGNGKTYHRADTNPNVFSIVDYNSKKSYLANKSLHQYYLDGPEQFLPSRPIQADEELLQLLKFDYLGSEKINGHECRHYRTMPEDPHPMQEYWYSPDLHCVILFHADPQTAVNAPNEWGISSKLAKYETKADPALFDLNGYTEKTSPQ